MYCMLMSQRLGASCDTCIRSAVLSHKRDMGWLGLAHVCGSKWALLAVLRACKAPFGSANQYSEDG